MIELVQVKLILHFSAVNRHLHFLASCQEPDSGNIDDVPKTVYQFQVPGKVMSSHEARIKGWTSVFQNLSPHSAPGLGLVSDIV